MKKQLERALLVGAYFEKFHKDLALESLSELYNLAKTAKIIVKGTFLQYLEKVNSATYIGKGKLEEVKAKTKEMQINTLIFNSLLSPTQARNIAKFTKCNVVDRTELILDIFAKHARTKQAKIQVEIAQLKYNYSRLRRLWTHLERIEGGIGFRGPGEKQIELDRREIQKKITILNKKLENIKKVTATQMKQRKKAVSISLVGYTNAGKSTLFNALTNENKLVADKLFATLDSTTRILSKKFEEPVVVTDTIGFISDLPPLLIESFHSTLAEVREADLLLHVVDLSNSRFQDNIAAVDNVLEDLGVHEKNILMVFNKIDKVDSLNGKFLRKLLLEKYPHAVFLSAKNGENVDLLFEKIQYFLKKSKKITTLEIPVSMPKLLTFLYNNSEIIEKKYLENKNSYEIQMRISHKLYPNVLKQIDNFKFLESINSK